MLFLGLCGGVGRSDRRSGDEGLVRENDEDGLSILVRCVPGEVFMTDVLVAIMSLVVYVTGSRQRYFFFLLHV